MICPKCLIQMHQYKKLGGGKSEKDVYEIWEVKICDNCGRRVKEVYTAKVLNDREFNQLIT